MATKIFKNTTKKAVVDPLLGEVPAGEQVSITTDGPINVTNPALVEVVEKDASNGKN